MIWDEPTSIWRETRRLFIMAFMYMDVFDHGAFCVVAAVFECKSLSCVNDP